jgi:hypothetical protein
MTAPTLSFAAAAKACGVSESTLRRRRPELLAAGAVQTARGWLIPVPALVELGLMDRTTAPDPVTAPDSPPAARLRPSMAAPDVEPLEPLLTALRAQLAAAETRAAVAEAVAAERERIITAQAQTLRMLEGGKSVTPHIEHGPVTPVPSEPLGNEPAPVPVQERRRRWWRF